MNKIFTNNSYFAYLANNYFRKPSGYLCGLVYVIYLSMILIFVPLIINTSPLFLWTNETFNISIFNLIFIAVFCAIEAVIIFRDGRDDGTELIIASKPFTRTKILVIKFGFYILVILCLSLICMLIATFTLCFGEYNILTNPTGMDFSLFSSLIASMFLGNVINMLIFGSIAVLICMVSGKVATMIGTITIAFVLAFLNFLIPQVIVSPQKTLKDNYSLSINSYSFLPSNSFSKKTNELEKAAFVYGLSEVYNTSEYWTKAQDESKISYVNYFDIGGQLSALFNLFDLQSSTMQSAINEDIGDLTNYKYTINQDQAVMGEDALDSSNSPYYVLWIKNNQGIKEVYLKIAGAENDTYSMGTEFLGYKENYFFFLADAKGNPISWLQARMYGFDFNSLTNDEVTLSAAELAFFDSWGDTEIDKNSNLYEKLYVEYNKSDGNVKKELNSFYDAYIKKFNSTTDIVFADLSLTDQFILAGKARMYIFHKNDEWFIPYKNLSNEDVINKYNGKSPDDIEYVNRQNFNSWCLYEEENNPFEIGNNKFTISNNQAHIGDMDEFHNLYFYDIEKYVDTTTILISWTIIAFLFYGIGVIIYAKTDLK